MSIRTVIYTGLILTSLTLGYIIGDLVNNKETLSPERLQTIQYCNLNGDCEYRTYQFNLKK